MTHQFITQYLEFVAEHSSQAKFLLAHGIPFTTNENTYKGKRGKQHECFANSAHEALNKNRIYVEGYITCYGVPLEHAWTTDNKGNVFDPTLKPPCDRIGGYFGIPFKTEYLAQCLMTNKVYGLLGYASIKTLKPLLNGEVQDFKVELTKGEPQCAY